MNRYEEMEVERLNEKYRPLGAWEYFGYNLLFLIPLVGFICLIVFSFINSNINRRNFARSFFCVYVIVAVILVIVAAGGFAAIASQK